MDDTPHSVRRKRKGPEGPFEFQAGCVPRVAFVIGKSTFVFRTNARQTSKFFLNLSSLRRSQIVQLRHLILGHFAVHLRRLFRFDQPENLGRRHFPEFGAGDPTVADDDLEPALDYAPRFAGAPEFPSVFAPSLARALFGIIMSIRVVIEAVTVSWVAASNMPE